VTASGRRPTRPRTGRAPRATVEVLVPFGAAWRFTGDSVVRPRIRRAANSFGHGPVVELKEIPVDLECELILGRLNTNDRAGEEE
jgi:hypothetical protein